MKLKAQPKEQTDFDQHIEKCTRYKIPLAAELIDYNKAFNSVEIPDVITLEEQGVENQWRIPQPSKICRQ